MRRAMLLAAVVFAGSCSGAAAAGGSGNPVNDRLLAMNPQQQAETLSKMLENSVKGCAGTSAFPMGVTPSGQAKGYAYWSLRCKDGRAFVLQINPAAAVAATDCANLKGTGKECFKKF